MTKFKLIFQEFPEYYLTILVLLAGYTPPISITPLSIILAVVLILQIISKNRILGLIIAGIFAIINFYMLLALMSEFNEFTSFSPEARNLLLVGISLLFLNIVAIGIMIYKYSYHIESKDKQIEASL